MATQVQSAGRGFWLGRRARRALRSYSRSERQMVDWLASNGLPVSLAFGAVWAVRLAVVAVLLYAAFWLAIVVLIALGAAWVADNSGVSDDDTWPFMSWDERRPTTGYDPVPYEDIEHPSYPDEKDI